MFEDVSDSGRRFESQLWKDLLRLRNEKVGRRTPAFGEGSGSGGDEGGEDSSDSFERASDDRMVTSRGGGLEDSVSEDVVSSALVFAWPDFERSFFWLGSSGWRRC